MSVDFVEELLACLGVQGGGTGDAPQDSAPTGKVATEDKQPTPGPTDDTPTDDATDQPTAQDGTADSQTPTDTGSAEPAAQGSTDGKPGSETPATTGSGTDQPATQDGTSDAPGSATPTPVDGSSDSPTTQGGTGDAPPPGTPVAEPPPAPPPPMDGLMQIDPLYGDADFAEFFTIRRASYDLSFQAPRGLRLACDGAAAKVQMAAVARIKDAVEKAVANMRAGLGTAATPGTLSYSDAEKDILDPLNKRIQIEIDAILDEATKAFKAITPDNVEADAVARFSKFKFLGSLRFPGGDAPTANREKIKPLLSELQAVLVETKGINTVGTALANTAADFAKAWQDTQKNPGETPETEQPEDRSTQDGTKDRTSGRTAPQPSESRKLKMLGDSDVAMLRPKADAVSARLKDFDVALDKVEKLHAQIEKLTKQIERINKKEGGAAQVEEDRKAYGAVEQALNKFKGDAGRLSQVLTEAVDGARTVRLLMETPFIADTPARVDNAAKSIKAFEIVQQGRDLYHRAKDLADAVKEA